LLSPALPKQVVFYAANRVILLSKRTAGRAFPADTDIIWFGLASSSGC